MWQSMSLQKNSPILLASNNDRTLQLSQSLLNSHLFIVRYLKLLGISEVFEWAWDGIVGQLAAGRLKGHRTYMYSVKWTLSLCTRWLLPGFMYFFLLASPKIFWQSSIAEKSCFRIYFCNKSNYLSQMLENMNKLKSVHSCSLILQWAWNKRFESTSLFILSHYFIWRFKKI